MLVHGALIGQVRHELGAAFGAAFGIDWALDCHLVQLATPASSLIAPTGAGPS